MKPREYDLIIKKYPDLKFASWRYLSKNLRKRIRHVNEDQLIARQFSIRITLNIIEEES